MSDALFDRIPPHSIEAERAVLGACLLDADAVLSATEGLVPEDFYDTRHRVIFDIVTEMARRNRPVDAISFLEEARKKDLLERLGGQALLAELVDSIPTTANVGYHVGAVREKAVRRRMILAGAHIARLGYDEARETADVLDEAERMLFELSSRGRSSAIRHVREILPATFQHITDAFQGGKQVLGTSTGYVDFDKITGGMQPGNLVIIAARPSMGKTAFAINIAQHTAINERKPVLVFSLEMGGDQLVQRMLGAEARINIHDLRSGNFPHSAWDRLTDAAGKLSGAPIYIDDSSDLSTLDLRARARRFMAEVKGDVGLVVVDYLQLMRTPRSAESRQQEVAEISRALKGVARELNVPVVALSQLSRAVEQRIDKRPVLADLRDSGAIEQDADMVLLLYRPGYYERKTAEEDDPRAEIIIAKHRNGPTGTVNLVFLKEFALFVSGGGDRWS